MGRAIRDERLDMSLLVPLSYNKASAGDEGSDRLRSDESYPPVGGAKLRTTGGYRWCKGERPPLTGGRTGVVDSSSPTHKGSINQVASSFRGSFEALPLRPTAMIRRTSARSFCMRLMGGVVVLM